MRVQKGSDQLEICVLGLHHNVCRWRDVCRWASLRRKLGRRARDNGTRKAEGPNWASLQEGASGSKDASGGAGWAHPQRDGEAHTNTPRTLQTKAKTATKTKKNEKNEKNTEGVRAIPETVDQKRARKTKRSSRPVRWCDPWGGRDKRAPFHKMDDHQRSRKRPDAQLHGKDPNKCQHVLLHEAHLRVSVEKHWRWNRHSLLQKHRLSLVPKTGGSWTVVARKGSATPGSWHHWKTEHTVGVWRVFQCGGEGCAWSCAFVGHRPFTRLASQPSTWADNGGVGHLSRQPLSVEVYRSAPRSTCRSKHKRSPQSRQEFLQTPNAADRLAKNGSGCLRKRWKASELRWSLFGLDRNQGVWARAWRRWRSRLASQAKPINQSEERSDNRYLRRARLRHKRHNKAGENLWMWRLQTEIHTRVDA